MSKPKEQFIPNESKSVPNIATDDLCRSHARKPLFYLDKPRICDHSLLPGGHIFSSSWRILSDLYFFLLPHHFNAELYLNLNKGIQSKAPLKKLVSEAEFWMFNLRWFPKVKNGSSSSKLCLIFFVLFEFSCSLSRHLWIAEYVYNYKTIVTTALLTAFHTNNIRCKAGHCVHLACMKVIFKRYSLIVLQAVLPKRADPAELKAIFEKVRFYLCIFFSFVFASHKRNFSFIIRFMFLSFQSNSKAQRVSLYLVSFFLFTVCQRQEEWRVLHVAAGLCEPFPPCPHRHPAVGRGHKAAGWCGGSEERWVGVGDVCLLILCDVADEFMYSAFSETEIIDNCCTFLG